MTLAGRFRIHGNIRFLSHQETMRVIARAIVRSGIEPSYSQGYNPHLRLSLPLPRNVGLASDDELFCVRIEASENLSFKDLIAEQMPEGLELVSVEITTNPVTYQPVEVEYLVKPAGKGADIQKINERIGSGGEIPIERTINKEGDVKTVDVAKFLKSFEIVQVGVRVSCKVLPTGTIRPDEILRLLNMDSCEISDSITRKKIIWQTN